MTWTAAVLATGTGAILMLVAFYLYLWWRNRQPSMGLWALGWSFYVVRMLTLAGEVLRPPPTPWRVASLASLGLCSFLLWAGMRAFVGQRLPFRPYLWALFPVLSALTLFIPAPMDPRISAIPALAFSAVASGFVVSLMLRYGRIIGRAIGGLMAFHYGLWAALEIGRFYVSRLSLWSVVVLVLTVGLSMLLALALMALSLIEAERSARRRAQRFDALSALTAAAGRLVSTGELLETALDELARLLQVEGGLGIYLLHGSEEGACLRRAVARDLPADCQEWSLEDPCICAVAVRTRQLVSTRAPHAPLPPGPPGCPCNLAVPLVSRAQVLGALCAALPSHYPLTEGELRALETVGRQLGLALENAQLVEAMAAEMGRLRALAVASRQMALELDVDEVLAGIVTTGMGVIGADRAAVYVYDAEDDRLEVSYARGLSSSYLDFLTSAFRQVPGSRVLQDQQMVWVRDAWSDPESQALREAARAEGFRSYLVLPLAHLQRLVGALVFYHDEIHRYGQDDLAFCQALADYAAAALENALLYRQAQRRLEELSVAAAANAELYQAEREARELAERLQETALLVNSSLDLREVLEMILDQLARVVPYDSGEIHILEQDATRVIAVRNEPPEEVGRRYPLDEYPYNRRLARGEGPIIIRDVQVDGQGWVLHEGVESLRANIGVPLGVRDRVIGALIINSYQPRSYTEVEARIVEAFAQQAALAIDNARLYAEQQRRAEEARLLLEIANAVNSSLDLDYVLKQLTQRAARACEANRCTILLLDEQGEIARPLMAQFASGQDDHDLWRLFRATLHPQRVEEVAEAVEAVRTQRPVYVPDVRSSSIPRRWWEPFGIGSLLIVPLVSRGRVIGMLGLDRTEVNSPFAPAQVDLAMTIGSQAAVAIENARLYQETSLRYQEEQQRRREAETLHRATQAMTTSLELSEVLDRILTELQQVVPYDSASVQLWENEDLLTIIACRGFPNPEQILGLTFDPQREDNPNGQVLRSLKPLILEDAAGSFGEFGREPHAAANIHGWLGVPLVFRGRPIGLLALDKHEPGFYTPEHARLALAFAGQAAIALENARLYKRLEEQSAQQATVVRELQDLDRLRDQVIQNVSHELRTPLTLVRGYVDLLLSGDLGPLSAVQRNALEVVSERTAVFSRLIHNLAALRSLPRDALTLAPLSIAELLRQVLRSFRRQASRAKIELEAELADDLALVLGDREYLSLAFSHLVENAIKFSPPGGQVKVRAWMDGQRVCVTVQDQGIGIGPEHIERVFERFYQIDGSSTRRFGGMGIGLALVWEIVEAHQGTVNVESQPGRGSTFLVTLHSVGQAEPLSYDSL